MSYNKIIANGKIILVILFILFFISFSFALPITVTIDPLNVVPEADETNNSKNLSPNVVETGGINILYVPVDWAYYADSFERVFVPLVKDQNSFMFATYPFSRDNFRSRISMRNLDLGLRENQKLSPIEILSILKRLNREYLLAGSNYDKIVGVVPGFWFSFHYIGSEGVTSFLFPNVALVDAATTISTSHEVGHTYGLCDEYNFLTWNIQHKWFLCPNAFPSNCEQDLFRSDAYCPGSIDTNGYSFLRGNINAVSPFTKIDSYTSYDDAEDARNNEIGQHLAKCGPITESLGQYSFQCTYYYFNFMGSAVKTNRWISKQTYSHLLSSLSREFSKGSLGLKDLSPSSVVFVSGLVDLQNNVELDDFYILQGKPSENIVSGDYSLKLLDSSDNILSDTPFSVSFTLLSNPPVDLNTAFFGLAVPWVEGTKKIAVDVNGLRKAERLVSLNAPVVSGVSVGRGVIVSGLSTVSWNAFDVDGDDLSFVLQYSDDGGASWKPLAIDVRGNSFEWNADFVDPGSNFGVKVIATDGVLTGEGVSNVFTVRAPDIGVSTSEWDLGEFDVFGDGVSQDFFITNEGNADLVVSSIVVSDSLFVVSGISLPLTLSPGVSQNFIVSLPSFFGGKEKVVLGEIDENIVVVSNDPNELMKVIDVVGELVQITPFPSVELVAPFEAKLNEPFTIFATVRNGEGTLRDASAALELPVGLVSSSPLVVDLNAVGVGADVNVFWSVVASQNGLHDVRVNVSGGNFARVSSEFFVSVTNVQLSSVELPPGLSSGEPIDVSVQVRNLNPGVSYSEPVVFVKLFFPDGSSNEVSKTISLLGANKTESLQFFLGSSLYKGNHAVEVAVLRDSGVLLDSELVFFEFDGNGSVDLSPTQILFNSSDLVAGRKVFFDSGVKNSGSHGSGLFNVKWFVDGIQEGYGSHLGVGADTTVLNGNSQFSWVAQPGAHTIKFVVDANNRVAESNEENNEVSVVVMVP